MKLALPSLALRHRMVWLAVVPLVTAIGAIAALMWSEMLRLEREQEALQEQTFMAARRDELKNYIRLALTSIDHLYGAGRDDEAAKAQARDILRAMNFGDDGYFFVYDLQGRNLVHPRQPELQGRNLWDLRDANGTHVIRELVARAREGGGFQRYEWPKPSTGTTEPKLGYAVMLERWGWMLGTGLYLDDIEAANRRTRANVATSLRGTFLALGAVAVVASLAVFAGGLVLNISEQRLADRKIRLLADRVVTSQEEERARVSRELHDHICQLLVSIKFRIEYAAQRAASGEPDGDALLRAGVLELSRAIGEVRHLSHALRPALLDDLGLPAALRLLGVELAQRTGLDVQVHVDDALPAIAADKQVDMFRIAQEALRNVERHARAGKVGVHLLAGADGAVLLRIVDDGAGFDVVQVERTRGMGIGLSNMRQRAERIGARFSIRSQPGQTCAELRLGGGAA